MPGQDGRGSGQVSTAWVVAVSVVLAGVLLSAVGVAALRSDTASADTRLARGADATVVLPDGTRRAAVEGETLPPGTTVLAGRTGARLETRKREVHLGADTTVTVLDGARQALDRGFVMVNADDAPGLSVRTPAATVSAQDDSLVRIDVGPLTRVGVLRGEPAQVRPTDRRATTVVPTLFQVQLRTGGLPGAASPFVLTPDDAYEMELAADLVRADADLTALARRLDADDAAGRVVQTALRRDVPGDVVLVPGAPLSERTLGYLMAAAAPADAPVGVRYASVRALRTDGGSWGIVAAIVRAPVERVAEALNALIDPMTIPAVAGEPLDPRDLIGLVDGEPAAPQPGEPAEPGQPSDPRPPQPSRSPGPTPAPTPSESAAPTDPVTDVVTDVVDTVLDIVGTPSPAPAPTGAPLPAPTATPLVELPLELPSLP